MDIYEELVMHYLCDGKPYMFLSPNFRLSKGWAFPDFVVLNHRDKVVSVVEVTTSVNPSGLVGTVQRRNVQWLDKLKEQLQGNAVVDDGWKYKVEVFVREEPARTFREKFAGESDVKIHVLDEKILCSWKWDWTERE